MNRPISTNEELDRRLWDLCFGLLEPAEATQLRALITSDPAAARAYSRVAQATDRVAVAAQLPHGPIALSPDGREAAALRTAATDCPCDGSDERVPAAAEAAPSLPAPALPEPLPAHAMAASEVQADVSGEPAVALGAPLERETSAWARWSGPLATAALVLWLIVAWQYPSNALTPREVSDAHDFTPQFSPDVGAGGLVPTDGPAPHDLQEVMPDGKVSDFEFNARTEPAVPARDRAAKASEVRDDESRSDPKEQRSPRGAVGPVPGPPPTVVPQPVEPAVVAATPAPPAGPATPPASPGERSKNLAYSEEQGVAVAPSGESFAPSALTYFEAFSTGPQERPELYFRAVALDSATLQPWPAAALKYRMFQVASGTLRWQAAPARAPREAAAWGVGYGQATLPAAERLEDLYLAVQVPTGNFSSATTATNGEEPAQTDPRGTRFAWLVESAVPSPSRRFGRSASDRKDRPAEVPAVPAEPSAQVAESLALHFFPEGGDWVAGVPQKIYFTAVDQAGETVAVKGQIVDDEQVLAEVASNAEGRGWFRAPAKAGDAYRLRFGLAGQSLSTSLPAPRAAPWALEALPAVAPEGGPLKLRLWLLEERAPIRLIAACRGAEVGRVDVVGPPLPADPGALPAALDVALPLDPAAAGLVRLTALDLRVEPPQPRAERLFYRPPSTRWNVAFAGGADSWQPGQEVRLELSARDERDQPGQAALGIRVQAWHGEDASEATSLATFALCCESPPGIGLRALPPAMLAGTDSANEQLDLRLATDGWRTFAPAPSDFAQATGVPATGPSGGESTTMAAPAKPAMRTGEKLAAGDSRTYRNETGEAEFDRPANRPQEAEESSVLEQLAERIDGTTPADAHDDRRPAEGKIAQPESPNAETTNGAYFGIHAEAPAAGEPARFDTIDSRQATSRSDAPAGGLALIELFGLASLLVGAALAALALGVIWQDRRLAPYWSPALGAGLASVLIGYCWADGPMPGSRETWTTFGGVEVAESTPAAVNGPDLRPDPRTIDATSKTYLHATADTMPLADLPSPVLKTKLHGDANADVRPGVRGYFSDAYFLEAERSEWFLWERRFGGGQRSQGPLLAAESRTGGVPPSGAAEAMLPAGDRFERRRMLERLLVERTAGLDDRQPATEGEGGTRDELPLSDAEASYSWSKAQGEPDAAGGVVYWNPLVVTGADGKASVTFRLPPGPRKYLVRIDAHGGGRLGYAERTIDAK